MRKSSINLALGVLLLAVSSCNLFTSEKPVDGEENKAATVEVVDPKDTTVKAAEEVTGRPDSGVVKTAETGKK